MKPSYRKRNIARHTRFTCSCEHAVSTCTYTHTGHTDVPASMHTSGAPFHVVNNTAFFRSFFFPSSLHPFYLLLPLSVHIAAAFSLLCFNFSFVSVYLYQLIDNQFVYTHQIVFGNRPAR